MEPLPSLFLRFLEITKVIRAVSWQIKAIRNTEYAKLEEGKVAQNSKSNVSLKGLLMISGQPVYHMTIYTISNNFYLQNLNEIFFLF